MRARVPCRRTTLLRHAAPSHGSSPSQGSVFVRRYLGDMTEREEHTRQIGTGGAGGVLLKGFGAVGFLGGLALLVTAIVWVVRFNDRAGGIGMTGMGLFFVLTGRYLWRVPGRPVVELTDEGIIFHADVDPFMMLFTRMRRTVTYRWEHIEAIDVQPTPVGMTM